MKSYSKPNRHHINGRGGSIITYFREDIPSKLIKLSCPGHGKEYFLVELNLIKNKTG